MPIHDFPDLITTLREALTAHRPLLLHAGFGTGKTHALLAVAAALPSALVAVPTLALARQAVTRCPGAALLASRRQYACPRRNGVLRLDGDPESLTVDARPDLLPGTSACHCDAGCPAGRARTAALDARVTVTTHAWVCHAALGESAPDPIDAIDPRAFARRPLLVDEVHRLPAAARAALGDITMTRADLCLDAPENLATHFAAVARLRRTPVTFAAVAQIRDLADTLLVDADGRDHRDAREDPDMPDPFATARALYRKAKRLAESGTPRAHWAAADAIAATVVDASAWLRRWILSRPWVGVSGTLPEPAAFGEPLPAVLHVPGATATLRCVVPADAGDPKTDPEGWHRGTLRAISRTLAACQGRVLILTTRLSRIPELAAEARRSRESVFATRLLPAVLPTDAVLVGTNSLAEGFDCDLDAVVLDRLPFPGKGHSTRPGAPPALPGIPSEAWTPENAAARALVAPIAFPEELALATRAFAQAAGRLRPGRPRLLVVADLRMVTRGYGEAFGETLPPGTTFARTLA